MNLFLGNPISTLLLATSVALAVGILYWMKPPPPTVIVSSAMLWNRLLKERKKSTLLDRMRWLVSLLLAMTIAMLMVIASGNPELFSAEEMEIEDVSIVIDNSGTMATLTRNGRSRWDLALGIAEELITGTHPATEFILLDTAGQIGSRISTNKWETLEKLKDMTPSYEDIEQFPQLPERESRAVFISDGVSNVPVPPDVEVISVFEPAENVGITGLRIVPGTAGEPGSSRALVQVTNGSAIVKEVMLRASGMGGTNVNRSLTIEPRRSTVIEMDLSNFQQGPLRLSTTSVRDALTDDNVAYAVVPARGPTKITLVTSGNVYLETALTAMSGIELSTLTEEQYDPRNLADLYVFDRFIPKVIPSKPILYFLPADQPIEQTSISEPGQSLSDQVTRAHPLLQGITLSDLRVEKIASPDFLTDDSRILWGDTDEPLIVVSGIEEKRIQVGFSLDESNFPLQPAFPIFLGNAVGWMLESDIPTGLTPGRIELPGTDLAVMDLEGSTVETNSIDQRTVFYGKAPNLYSVNRGKDRVWMPVNVANTVFTLVNESVLEVEEYSNIVAATDIALTSQTGPGFWKLLVLIALVLMILEWSTYHRRITV